MMTPSGTERPNLADFPRRSAVNLRTLLIGSAAVTAICALVTYNDHVVMNSSLIGSYLPLALVLLLFLLVVVINSLLHRFAPRQAFSSAELSIIVLMTLIGCSIPATGLFRFFIPMLIAPFSDGATNPPFWDAFIKADLPTWLFPVDSLAEGRNNPVINQFMGRVQPGEPIPYRAWLMPLAGWGVFFCGWFTALIATVWIFRRQWSVNERLPFPLATIETALIAEPRRGRVLNDLLGSRLFWFGLLSVVLIQSAVALAKYYPKYVPLIPLRYSLGGIMANPPWSYFAVAVKASTIYFTFIGIAYFIQSRISFSLWATFLLAQLVNVYQRSFQHEISADAWRDQHLGASLAFTLGFLWIGRHHLLAVARQLIGRPGGTALTQSENYRPAAILALGGIGVMGVWLLLLGVQFGVVCGLIVLILLSHLIMARVVAETGLPFVRSDFTAQQLVSNLPAKWLTTRDMFFASMSYVLGPVTTRESAAVFSQHGMVVCDNNGVDTAKLARRLAGVIVWTVLLGYVVSAFSVLHTHYTFATPIAYRIQHPVLDPTAMDRPKLEMIEPVVRQSEGHFPDKAHSPAVHFSVGVVLTSALQVLSLRSASWPLLPVGYLLCSSWYISVAWFSLMLGWLAKVLILKFGGASMYQSARPVFIGAIFGEALAAAVWLVISLCLASSGYDYVSVPMLPP